jgi:hypothetical protein
LDVAQQTLWNWNPTFHSCRACLSAGKDRQWLRRRLKHVGICTYIAFSVTRLVEISPFWARLFLLKVALNSPKYGQNFDHWPVKIFRLFYTKFIWQKVLIYVCSRAQFWAIFCPTLLVTLIASRNPTYGGWKTPTPLEKSACTRACVWGTYIPTYIHTYMRVSSFYRFRESQMSVSTFPSLSRREWPRVTTRVARLFLQQHTKTRKNIPKDQQIYQRTRK